MGMILSFAGGLLLGAVVGMVYTCLVQIKR